MSCYRIQSVRYNPRPPKEAVTSGVARAFPGGRLAHPEGQKEEETEKSLRKNK